MMEENKIQELKARGFELYNTIDKLEMQRQQVIAELKATIEKIAELEKAE